MEINETLKRLRQERHLTQQELASLLGINLSSYQKYERPNNTVKPSLDALVKLADYYGVSVDHLLGRTVEQDDEDAVIAKYMSLPDTVRPAMLELLKKLAETDASADEGQSIKAAMMDVFSVMLDHIIAAARRPSQDAPASQSREDPPT